MMECPAQPGEMRVLAGIDEAGFGPVLGPLVIGATAWRVPADCDGSDLWRRLRAGVSKTPSRKTARLAINDSKKIYSSSKGLADLERGVLGTLAAQAGDADLPAPSLLVPFLDRICPQWSAGLEDHPWYEGYQSMRLPAAIDAAELATRANGFRVAMKRAGVQFLGAGLELVLEGRFNRLCETLGNKSRLLFCVTARLIQRLFDRFGRHGLVIVCDKQGGRDSYRSLLMSHWPDLCLSVLGESAEKSSYRLAAGDSGDAAAMEIWFLPKADLNYLPASLASMYCKYTRELFMRLLNGFWRQHVGDDLKHTAGYYGDGQRFIRDISAAAEKLGLPAMRFMRSR